MANIADLQAKFTGAARPNRFKVTVNYTGLTDLEFFCKAASQPQSNLGEVVIPYMGRNYKVPGDRNFENWSITILNEEGHAVRAAFEAWHDEINKYTDNTSSGAPHTFFGTTNVTQYDQKDASIYEYEFEQVWPTEIGPVELAWDSNDSIEEFTVTLSYNWMKQGSAQ